MDMGYKKLEEILEHEHMKHVLKHKNLTTNVHSAAQIIHHAVKK